MRKLNLLLVILLASFAEAFALSNFGLFEDSAIYYDLFKNLSDNGLYEGAAQFFIMTGKFEPVISVIFYLQSRIFPVTEFWFLFINYFFINILLSIGLTGFFSSQSTKKLALILLLTLLSYGFYSRALYFWRTMYALGFLLIGLHQTSNFKKLPFMLLAMFSHYTIVIFLGLYVFIKKFALNVTLLKFTILSLIAALLCLMAIKYTAIAALFVSGGETDLYFVKNPEHSFQAITAILFTLISLLCASSNYKEVDHKSLLRMLIFLCVFSLINTENYQLMSRISTPALLITPFIVLASWSRSLSMKFIKLATGLSILASFRLLYLFMTGGFVIAGQ